MSFDDGENQDLGNEDDFNPNSSAASTGSLLFRLSTISILIPLVAILLIGSWALYQGYQFTNKEIRLICLLLWLSTMITIAVAAIGGRRGGDGAKALRRGSPLVYVPLEESATPLNKWGQRDSRRNLRSVWFAVLGLPSVLFFVILLISNSLGIVLRTKDMKILVPALWAIGILSGLLVILRAGRKKLIYSNPSPRKDEESEQ